MMTDNAEDKGLTAMIRFSHSLIDEAALPAISAHAAEFTARQVEQSVAGASIPLRLKDGYRIKHVYITVFLVCFF